MKGGILELKSWCTCGADLSVRANPPEVAEIAHQAFRLAHDGEGHGPCNAQTARNARRRSDRARRRAAR